MIVFGFCVSMAVFGLALTRILTGRKRLECLVIAAAWIAATAVHAARLWG